MVCRPSPLKRKKKIMSTILLAQKKLNYMHNPVLLRDTKKCTYLKIKQLLSLIQHLKGKIFGMLALMRCLFSFVKLTFWCELSQCLDGKQTESKKRGSWHSTHTRAHSERERKSLADVGKCSSLCIVRHPWLIEL